MKLIVGLGNPGEKYQNNRHNVGHMLIDWLNAQVKSEKLKVKSYNSKFKIMKTNLFMNQSGSFVKKLIRNSSFVINNLIIVHDDLDIPLGKFKIQKGAGPKLHNGIASIEKALKTKDFWRVRIGVDSRTNETWVDGETYVLQDFNPEESKIMLQTFPLVFQKLVNIIKK